MYSKDCLLPSLPVPRLENFCESILPLVKPLVTGAMLEATRCTCVNFAEGAEGKKLHEALVAWQKSMPNNKSWLRVFWDSDYLNFRDSLPFYMNYGLTLNPDIWGEKLAVARCIWAFTSAAKKLWQGELAPEQNRDATLSMEQARFLFYTRLALFSKDTLSLCVPTETPYAVVFCRGYSFVLPLTLGDGQVRSVQSIETSLQTIRKQVANKARKISVGLLTGMPRRQAAILRTELLQKEQNQISLAILEQALFAVCLDGAESLAGFEHRLLAREPENRYYDKSLQIIAKPNGKVGLNLEHAGCDASIWIYFINHAEKLLEPVEREVVLAKVGAESANKATSKLQNDGVYCPELCWDIPKSVERVLVKQQENFAGQEQNLDLACLELPDYSRSALKKFKCSPDAFVQAAFQAAQWQVLGRFASAYEAVSMRNFAEGRTECARPASLEAKSLAQSIASGAPAKEIVRLFRLAEIEHKARLAKCQQGLGVERYLYGLKKMYAMFGRKLGLNKLPEVFEDAGVLLLKTNTLSTSGLSVQSLRHFCFAPVEREGFGIGYNSTNDALYLSVSAFKDKSQASELARAIRQNLAVLGEALEQENL